MLVHEEGKVHNEPESVLPDGGITEGLEPLETSAEDQFLFGEDIRAALQVVLQHLSLTEQEAKSVAPLFDQWQERTEYSKGQLVTYTDTDTKDAALYRVEKAHTSRQSLPPDHAKDLYSAVAAGINTSTLKEEI